MMAPSASYTGLSKWLHWLIALLVIGLVIVGLLLGSLPEGPVQNTAYDLHKSFGFVLLVLMVLRIANRIVVGAPPSAPGLERWQIAASHAVHYALYVLLIAQPIIGWIANSAFGAPINLFWVLELPPLIAKDEALADRMFGLHQLVGYAIAALAAIHIAAALHHHFIRKDDVLRRMAPRGLV